MRYVTFVICCILLSACGNDEMLDPTRGLILEVDRQSYTAVPIEYPHFTLFEFRVAATFTNHGREVVYLARCSHSASRPSYRVVSATADRAAYGPEVFACFGDVPGIPVRPGESRTDTLTIAGSGERDSGTASPIGEMEGEFRLVYFVGDARNPTPRPYAADSVASNVFEVRLGR